ncbi:phosphate metabolism protein 7 [Marasmius tenuissimus]|uniref:Phosphate metabolism protein 7 n=1 Tax=Marasmius tenuissimus TaxID=585030 RepID=A0ABR3AGQ7_9AGAR|nr:phosphate metabolism protein 7 [Marasmius tenuissimus]
MSDDATNARFTNNSSSTKSFLTALVANASLLAIELSAFVILKRRLGRFYAPRTYLPPPDKRAKGLPDGWWRWLPVTLKAPAQDIIHKNGLDAYMFLRFIKMLCTIFLVYSFASIAIIVPVDVVGIVSDRSDIERISWSNITNPLMQDRFSAHVVVVYLMTFFIFWRIGRELSHFIRMRHEFLISPSHSRLAQARTVLITSVPEELANEHDLRQFASFVPGGIDKVWIYRDTRSLNKLFEDRQWFCDTLESAEVSVLKKATMAWRTKVKAHKKMVKRQKKGKGDDVEKRISRMPSGEELEIGEPSRELLDELVPPDERPKRRMGFWGLFGRKVDLIEWCSDEIARLNQEIEELRSKHAEGKFLGSVFIRCNLQMGAHVLAQCVGYHEPLRMYDKWMEVNPKDIVWHNLDDGALEMRGRYVVSWAATIGLLIVWFFPVAAIGTLSNLDDLCRKVKWLQWACDAPNPVPGIIQGILPPLLLALLFVILPFILRFLAWYECIPRYSLISISVYHRFFLFLLLHGFLIVTISSGLTKAIEGILNNPTQTIQLLARELPGASIFFLTYMVSQGLAGAGIALSQLIPILLHFIRKIFLGRTPRQAYNVTFLMPSADIDITLPRLSLLATIGLAYSVLNPLINPLAFISYGTFFIAYKLLFGQVFDQPDDRETGGLYFPMAISNLFVGLYIQQVCLAALFFLKAGNEDVRTAALGQAISMVVLFAITLFVQTYFQRSFNPITTFLPMSLATKKMAKRYENSRKKLKLGAPIAPGGEEEEMDLFSKEQIKTLRRRIKKFPKKLDTAVDNLKAKVIATTATLSPLTPSPRKSGEDIELQRLRKSTDVNEDKDRRASESATHETTTTADSGFSNGKRVEEADHFQPFGGPADLYRIDSNVSRVSKASKTSKTSKASKPKSLKSRKSKEELPTFDAPAPAGIDLSDEDEEEDEEMQDDHAFDHPSTYEEQRWIWVPKDTLGLSEILVKELHDKGIEASDSGATMDAKGVVEVSRNPPDKTWTGGHDR